MRIARGHLSAALWLCVALLPASADQKISPAEAELRSAVGAGGRITFARGGTISLSGTIMITRDTILDGEGKNVVISGGDAVRVLHVSGGATLTLRNVTIARGHSSSGAAIYNDGGTVHAIGCSFINNTAQGSPGNSGRDGPGPSPSAEPFGVDAEPGAPGVDALGGSIWNSGNLFLAGCTFNGNRALGGRGGKGGAGFEGFSQVSAGGAGGAGGGARGGAVFSSGVLLISNCTFTANVARSGDGGDGGPGGASRAFLRGGDGGAGGNGGTAGGAAVHATGRCTIIGARFTRNSTSSGAGGIGGTGGTTFLPGDLGGAGGAGGAGGGAGGGAISFHQVDASLSLSAFIGNRVVAGQGGVARRGAGVTVLGANGNGGRGGDALGAVIEISSGSVTIDACAMSGNVAQAGDGSAGADSVSVPIGRFWPEPGGQGGQGGRAEGVIFNRGDLRLSASTIDGNSMRGGKGGKGGDGGAARTVDGSVGGAGGGGGGCAGGGVCNQALALIVNCTFFRNELRAGAGGIGGKSGAAVFGRSNGGDGGSGGPATGGAVCTDHGASTIIQSSTLAGHVIVPGAGGAAGPGSAADGTPAPGGLPGETGLAGGISLAAFGSGSAIIQNTIITGRSSTDHSIGNIHDAGHNLCDDASCGFAQSSSLNSTDPLLAPLADNGGPTRTLALRDGSPAIDASAPASCPEVDQRGFVRPVGAGCDIGAFEWSGRPVPPPGGAGFFVSGRVADQVNGLAGIRVRVGKEFTLTDENGEFGLVVPKPGRYLVKPVMPGARFTPVFRRVKVSSDTVVSEFVLKRIKRSGKR